MSSLIDVSQFLNSKRGFSSLCHPVSIKPVKDLSFSTTVQHQQPSLELPHEFEDVLSFWDKKIGHSPPPDSS